MAVVTPFATCVTREMVWAAATELHKCLDLNQAVVQSRIILEEAFVERQGEGAVAVIFGGGCSVVNWIETCKPVQSMPHFWCLAEIMRRPLG